MFKKIFELPNFQFFSYGVFMPMVFALTMEPSKWLAVGCVAYCAASGWLFAFCRFVDGVEAGVKLKGHPDDAMPEGVQPDEETAKITKK